MVSNEPAVIKSVFSDITKPSTFMGVASEKTGELLSVITGSNESAEEDYSNAVVQSLAPTMLDLLVRVYDIMPVMVSVAEAYSDFSDENAAIAAYLRNVFDDLETVLDMCYPQDIEGEYESDDDSSSLVFPEDGELLGDRQSIGDYHDYDGEYAEGSSGTPDSEHDR